MTAKELFLEAMRRTDAADYEGFLQLQAPDGEWHVPGADLRGREEIRAQMQPFWQGFSTGRHDLQRIVADGDTVYAVGVWHSVNDRDMPTPDGIVAATGRTVALRFSMVVDVDVAAGHATNVQLYFDQLDFLGQLGLLPQPAAA
jgi:uncharacterized protein (TIGR02246 family)